MSVGLVDRLVGPPATSAERDARRVGAALIWALLIGSALAAWCVPHHWAEAILWGDALAVGGMLLGFLFGIPRVFARARATAIRPAPSGRTEGVSGGNATPMRLPASSAPSQDPVPENQQSTENDASSKRLPTKPEAAAAHDDGVNTNLEEISDWLTKIIVGVSLVEINKARALLQTGAGYIAEALGGPSQSSVAYALLLYFSVTGFLGSYLLTRLYLQQAFRKAAG